MTDEHRIGRPKAGARGSIRSGPRHVARL